MNANYKNQEFYIESLRVKELAKHYGTPFYCYSRAMIAHNYHEYIREFAKIPLKTRVHYAVKANSNQAILTILQKLGAGADVVSVGEITRCLHAGFKGADIIFSGVGKNAHEIIYAIDHDIGQFNAESLAECDLLSQIAGQKGKKIHVALRINPLVKVDTHDKIATGRKGDKFGIDYDFAIEAYQYAHKLPNLIVDGLSMHIGSQITDLTNFESAYQKAKELIDDLAKHQIIIKNMDCGGGRGIDYQGDKVIPMMDYANLITRIFGNSAVEISVEPGRSIIGSAGFLITQVIRTKNTNHKNITIIDAAMNDLIRPTLYHGHHKILPAVLNDKKHIIQDFVGPICESGDFLAKERNAQPMEFGDILAFANVGAYGAAMSSMYNSRDLIAEVLVDGDKHALIRRKFQVAEQIKLDNVPDFLQK